MRNSYELTENTSIFTNYKTITAMLPYSPRLCLTNIKNRIYTSVWGTPRTKLPRIGVLTNTLNEVATSAFVVGSIIDLVDLYVFVDTGSQDGTEDLIRMLFADQIKEGRLIFKQLGRLTNYNTSVARNYALEIFRDHQIDYFIHLDGDDILPDQGARSLISMIQKFPVEITNFYYKFYELYQGEVLDTEEWLEAIKSNRDVFWQMFIFYRQTVWSAPDCQARGSWTDEAKFGIGEQFHHNQSEVLIGTESILAVHYGWARPVLKKREKIAIWYGDPNADARVEQLHLDKNRHRLQGKFHQHPEIFQRLIDPVLDFIRSRS